jgi:hypothetical protein
VAYDDEVLATGPVAFWLPEAAAVVDRVGGRDASYVGAPTLFPGVIGTRSAPHCSGTVFTKRTYHGLYQTNLRGRADRLHGGDLRRLGGSSSTWTGMRARPARPKTAGLTGKTWSWTLGDDGRTIFNGQIARITTWNRVLTRNKIYLVSLLEPPPQ